jgi:hypothetical protein
MTQVFVYKMLSNTFYDDAFQTSLTYEPGPD